MITEPGLYPDISHAAYHAGICPTRALTNSAIGVLLNETPFDYRYAPKREATGVMDIGSVTHELALGKGSGFVVSPHDEYRTDVAKAWKRAAIDAGLTPIKQKDYDEAEEKAKIIRSIIKTTLRSIANRRNYPPDADLTYQTEVPFAWIEETDHGPVWCTGMLDVWCESLLVALDPKITTRIGKQAQAHMVNMGWDRQAAWYERGLSTINPDWAGRIKFGDLMIKPKPPYTSRLIWMRESWRASSEIECLRALRVFAWCMATDTWPGYPPEGEELDGPTWEETQRLARAMDEEVEDA